MSQADIKTYGCRFTLVGLEHPINNEGTKEKAKWVADLTTYVKQFTKKGTGAVYKHAVEGWSSLAFSAPRCVQLRYCFSFLWGWRVESIRVAWGSGQAGAVARKIPVFSLLKVSNAVYLTV